VGSSTWPVLSTYPLSDLVEHGVRGFLVHADGRVTDPGRCRVD
jgi:hypothetical protein